MYTAQHEVLELRKMSKKCYDEYIKCTKNMSPQVCSTYFIVCIRTL